MKPSKIFKKNQFEEKKPITRKTSDKEEIDEFFDLDDNNMTVSNNSQIYTNVPKSAGDESEFEQGIPTITDKLAMYANPRNWWQLFLRGYPLIRTYGLYESDFKDIIKELLDKQSDDNSLVPKDDEGKKLKKIKTQIKSDNFSDADLKDLEELIKEKLKNNG